MKTILFAEDEKSIRELFGLLAKCWGYASLLAENSEQAITLLGKREIDLVVTDELMPPGEDGWAVVHASRELFPTRPIVMVSASADPERCRETGIELLVKPFVPTTLRTLIDNYLRAVTLEDVYQLQMRVENEFQVQDSDQGTWEFFRHYITHLRNLEAAICEETAKVVEIPKLPKRTELGPKATAAYRAVHTLVKAAKQ
ncbi:MAG: response regulator [bacterium]|nr:response regulator [bacterium]